jgi:gamma-glutamyltranspeptidase/glutathione hydrolase
MVVTGNAAASWAGMRMLDAGGNAVDAAVAAAFALGVAEPGSSGIGGQTYLLVRMRDGTAVAIDGSARAPLRAVREELYSLHETTLLIRPATAFSGHRSIATPGTLAALDAALRRFGTKSLAEVVEPAIEIAEFGSVWTPAQRSFLVDYTTKVQASVYLSALFLRDSITPWSPEHVYCNPDLACFLRRLAAVGVSDFYRGAIAQEIAGDMAAHGGWLGRAELAQMSATIKQPLRGRYRGLEVLSFPFPGGGATVVEALGILDRVEARRLREDSVDRLHLLVEACRLAYADSFPAHRPLRLPDELAADAGYVAGRAARIRLDRALHADEVSASSLSLVEAGGTTQVSVADSLGNVVSLTQTLGSTFGSGVATDGFGFAYNSLLNGYDFRDPHAWSYLMPLQPPINSMAPSIVLEGGRPLLVIGSAGTARIGPAIVGTIVNVVDRGLPLGEAVAAPRALWGGNLANKVYLEIVDPITVEQADTLAQRGFARQERLTYPATPLDVTDFGGVNAILLDQAGGTMIGVGDPRRQGVAQGESEVPDASPAPALPECWRSLLAAGEAQTTPARR